MDSQNNWNRFRIKTERTKVKIYKYVKINKVETNMYQKTEREIMQNWEGDANVPIVSICSTAYNLESCVAEAIDSFLMQETNFPFEILIRDDCSTDKTAKIIKEYASRYPQLIKPIYEKENTYSKGIKPMLQVIKMAKGNYIATCDADDYWTNTLKLQKQVDFLENNPLYCGCFHDCMRIYEGEKSYQKKSLRIGNQKIAEEVDLVSIIDKNNIDSSSILFRNFIDKIPKYWLETSKDDYALMVLIAEQGEIKYLPEVMSVYRMHDDSIWSSRGEIYKEEEAIKFYHLLQEYFPEDSHIQKALSRKLKYTYYSLSRKLVHEKQRLNSLYYLMLSLDFPDQKHKNTKYYNYFKELVRSIVK